MASLCINTSPIISRLRRLSSAEASRKIIFGKSCVQRRGIRTRCRGINTQPLIGTSNILSRRLNYYFMSVLAWSQNTIQFKWYQFSSQTQQQENKEDATSATALTALQSLPKLSPRIINKIHSMKSRHDEISSLLREGGDQTSLGKELSSLSPVSHLVDQLVAIHDEKLALQELLSETNKEAAKDDDHDEFTTEIENELTILDNQLEPLAMKLLHSLVPILNPHDAEDLTTADAVIDIRAGTGGDEAALFAAEIMAGYEAVGRARGEWEVEVLSVHRTDLGGVKEASLVVSSKSSNSNSSYNYTSSFLDHDSSSSDHPDSDTGIDGQAIQQLLHQLGPYGFFHYESGVHRVQRVPVNDNKLQTSAVSVAVLPSIPENKNNSSSTESLSSLPLTELKIETMRASGAGGQHVNTTESAVRITHIPTGIMAYMQEERSQHKNKAKAMRLVAARVYQLRKEQALRDRSAARSSLMGGGDRSERIRTYNYPQDRITDHRCKVSVTGVGTWLGGGGMVGKFGPYLYQMEREERVLALEEEEEGEEEVGSTVSKKRGSGGKGSKR